MFVRNKSDVENPPTSLSGAPGPVTVYSLNAMLWALRCATPLSAQAQSHFCITEIT